MTFIEIKTILIFVKDLYKGKSFNRKFKLENVMHIFYILFKIIYLGVFGIF